MTAGLQGEGFLTANAAKKVYDCIMRNRDPDELLATTYSRLLSKYFRKKEIAAERKKKKRRRGKVVKSDDEAEGLTGPATPGDEGTPGKVTKPPPPM